MSIIHMEILKVTEKIAEPTEWCALLVSVKDVSTLTKLNESVKHPRILLPNVKETNFSSSMLNLDFGKS